MYLLDTSHFLGVTAEVAALELEVAPGLEIAPGCEKKVRAQTLEIGPCRKELCLKNESMSLKNGQ